MYTATPDIVSFYYLAQTSTKFKVNLARCTTLKTKIGVSWLRNQVTSSAHQCASFRWPFTSAFFGFKIWYLFILRGMVTSLILQGKLYTLGGVQSKTVDQYDVETDTWANFFPSLRWSLQHRLLRSLSPFCRSPWTFSSGIVEWLTAWPRMETGSSWLEDLQKPTPTLVLASTRWRCARWWRARSRSGRWWARWGRAGVSWDPLSWTRWSTRLGDASRRTSPPQRWAFLVIP